MKYGTIVQISESVVDVKFEQGQLPRVRESVVVSAGVKCWVMEVAQHLGNSTVRCVLLTKNDGLTRGMMAEATGASITVPVGAKTLGRVFDVIGNVIDGGALLPDATERRSIYRKSPGLEIRQAKAEMLETGIKAIDLLCPYPKGGKIGLFAGTGYGKRTLARELICNLTLKHGGRSVFAGIVRSIQEGSELLEEFRSSGALSHTALVLGNMGEPPGARMRLALTGLTMAEYFRDAEHKDVLLVIDNFSRLLRSSNEVSTILGGMPRAVEQLPTYKNGMAELQERIAATRYGSLTSIQTVYAPEDEQNSSVRAAFFNLDAATVLSRRLAEQGIYPAIDPLKSSSWLMEPDKLGEEHFQLARRVRKILERCSEIQELAIVHHLDELSEEDMTTIGRAVKIRLFLTQPLHAAERFTKTPGTYVPLKETLRGFKAIVNGEMDDYPDSAFFNAGTIDDVKEKALRL